MPPYPLPIPIILSVLFCGIFFGAALVYYYAFIKNKNEAARIIIKAEEEAAKVLKRADTTSETITKELESVKKEINERKESIIISEKKLSEKEERLEKKIEETQKKYEEYLWKLQELDTKKWEIEFLEQTIQKKLEEISRMSIEEAREQLLSSVEERYEKDLLARVEKKKRDTEHRLKEISQEMIIGSIQQYASDVTAEFTQTIFPLESDDLKGKLIGKEWRNIIAFERATGVSLIIDDSPDTVFLSSFDLFRRYIAKKSLEELIADKRIQPARIEEIVEKNQLDAEKLIFDLWKKTVDEMGIFWIPEDILPLIGKFRFRTSYGQNLLQHSKEVAYIAKSIAKLIWADENLAFTGGLLHDLGKSLDHDIEWTHPEIGGRIARKYWLDEKLINIIEWHHDWVPQICIETKIVQIADAISAVRPWARRMNIEDYIKRISEMENIAMSMPGVNKAFALSAGREIRVFVDADTISDINAEKLARDIATTIEENCSYPGEVKVNLLREKRVIEYAK